MGREIKFRGQRIDTKTWVYGVPVFSVNGRCYMIHGATEDAINTVNAVDFIYSEVAPETVGEYTGLKDKNGKEIHEGDILRNNVIKKDGSKEKGRPEQVIYNAPFFMTNLNGAGRLAFTPTLEIIGNIYENPELLEGKK